jgi:quinolinate synthase
MIAAYINTTTALKARCDVCVTSSTAVKIISALPTKDILFIPDKNLGAYVRGQVPDKNIILWDGFCYVHNHVTPQAILAMKKLHPHAKVAIHPECPPDTVALADMIGSTKAIIDFAEKCDNEVIFVTERGVYDWFTRKFPQKVFWQLEPELLTCNNMKRTDLPAVLAALRGDGGDVITIDDALREKALRSIRAMLHYGG